MLARRTPLAARQGLLRPFPRSSRQAGQPRPSSVAKALVRNPDLTHVQRHQQHAADAGWVVLPDRCLHIMHGCLNFSSSIGMSSTPGPFTRCLCCLGLHSGQTLILGTFAGSDQPKSARHQSRLMLGSCECASIDCCTIHLEKRLRQSGRLISTLCDGSYWALLEQVCRHKRHFEKVKFHIVNPAFHFKAASPLHCAEPGPAGRLPQPKFGASNLATGALRHQRLEACRAACLLLLPHGPTG